VAIYHFTAKAISMGSGESAVHRAAYHARTQLPDERNAKETRDYAHKGDLAWSGIFAPQDAPEWTRDRAQLWNRAEAAERQANGQPARNIEFALPNELTRLQQIRLLTDFAREQFARKGMIADANIHSDYDEEGRRRTGADPAEPRNDHAHVLLTMRRLDGQGFKKTKTDAREWNSKEQLLAWRAGWAKAGAKALQKAGFEREAARFGVGHLTLPEQRRAALDRGDTAWAEQLDREPDIKLGAASAQMEKRGEDSERSDKRRAVFNRNAERQEIRAEAQIIDLALARLDRQQRATAGPGQGTAKAVAERIRAANDARYQAMRARHDAAYQRRQAEIADTRAGRETGRQAIYGKYQTALDAVWNPQPGPKTVSPDMDPWRRFGKQMDERKAKFEQREKSLFGRYLNAWSLLSPSRRGSIITIHLALNAAQRRKLFDQQQRRYFARNAPARPARPQGRPRPETPEPKRVQADRLKTMRTAELAAHDRQQKAAVKAMEARHQFQREAEAAEKAAHSRDSKAAWEAHREAFAQPERQARLAQREATTAREIDRQHIDAEAENSAVEANEAFGAYHPLEAPEAIHEPPRGQGDAIPAAAPATPSLTPEEQRQARIDAIRAAREARDRDDRQPGRERGR
jgi:hypothetical protein